MKRESINGLSATEVIVKDKSYEHIGDDEDEILNIGNIKKEIMEPTEPEFLTNVTFKEVLDNLTRESNAPAKVLEEEVIEPHIKFETEVSIKQEELDQNIYGLEDTLNKHLRIMLTRLKCYMCEHCPVYYKKKKDLLYHIHTEHNFLFRNPVNITKSLHYCSICDKKLTYKIWHSHMNQMHYVHLNKIKCKVCNKVFKHKRYLQRHQMYVHENVKPSWRFRNNTTTTTRDILLSKVACTVCSKEFINKHALHTHTKNCHSEKATCKICNSILKCKTYLYTHMRRVHYDDGKVHCCNQCHKQFKSPRYLNIHKRNAHQ